MSQTTIQNSSAIIAIQQWILHLMNKENIPYDKIDHSFNMEDGMSLDEYFKYEKNNFQFLSSIFDLNEIFKIKILYQHELTEKKQFYFIYIINQSGKIVCKMNITLVFVNNNYYIASNNYLAQIVPKFGIWDGAIKEVGLAIKTKYPLRKIVSNQLELISLEQGNSFEEDSFYSARFLACDGLENNIATFTLYMQKDNQLIKEKRKIFFDAFQETLKPYELTDESLILINDSYPVSISAMGERQFNKAYPRNLKLSLKQYSSFIITDCLDNDWHIN